MMGLAVRQSRKARSHKIDMSQAARTYMRRCMVSNLTSFSQMPRHLCCIHEVLLRRGFLAGPEIGLGGA